MTIYPSCTDECPIPCDGRCRPCVHQETEAGCRWCDKLADAAALVRPLAWSVEDAADKLEVTAEHLRAYLARHDHGADTEPDSWAPIDLGPYLRGEVQRPMPTIGIVRSDGLRLIYAGKEHSVIGEMEAGKSWLALASAAAEITMGRTVIYVHFEEADPSDSIERLLALGATPGDVEKLFRFIAPDRPITPEQVLPLLDPIPSLVVLDGVNEGMSMHGTGPRDEDGVATFRRRLIKPFVKAGAAVLTADHVVKDGEKRGRYALGSVHKGNALSGSLVVLENAEPFGRGARGRSHVFVTKDRPGHLRQHGRADRKTPGRTYMGELVVDDTRARTSYLDVRFWAPSEDDDRAAGDDTGPFTVVDEKVFAVVSGIIAAGKVANLRLVRATAGLGKDAVDGALERLVFAERLTESRGPNRMRVFGVAEDQSSDGGS